MTTCSMRLDRTGLTVDGLASDIPNAVARCNGAGRADLVLVDDAPSTVYAELAAALQRAGITVAARRNGRARRRPSRRQAAPRYTREGRVILRDGQPIVSLQRVDLGDQRYAITPHEADLLVQQVVTLLNGKRRGRSDPGRNAATHRIFIFKTYPADGSPSRTRWYVADPPTTWDDAKRRLVAAGVLDDRVTLPTEWKLTADPPPQIHVPTDRLHPLP